MTMDIFTNTMPLSLLAVEAPAIYEELLQWDGEFEFWSAYGWCKVFGAAMKNSVLVYRAVKPPTRVVRWHNLYRDGWVGDAFLSRADVDGAAASDRIAVLRIERDEDGGNVTVDVEPV